MDTRRVAFLETGIAQRSKAHRTWRLSFSPKDVPRKVPGAEFSRFGRDHVILDPSGKILRGLNPTAARIWELCDGHRSMEQISEEIAREFQAPAETVRADVQAFFDQLLARKLVTR
jgi:pyrroloquinoline quinone biosynthesis protein D